MHLQGLKNFSEVLNPFQSSVAFHIKTTHLNSTAYQRTGTHLGGTAYQRTGLYMKCSTRLKWVKDHEIIFLVLQSDAKTFWSKFFVNIPVKKHWCELC